ncbi:hypothetical protein JXO52_06280 [bacterium]|nr:hypothetical protein [bacterium]
MKFIRSTYLMLLVLVTLSYQSASSQSNNKTDEKLNTNSNEVIENQSNSTFINASAELLVVKDFTTSDFKFFKSYSSLFSMFIRYRTTIDKKDNVNDFLLTDFYFNIFPHIDAVFELQAGSGFGTIPRFGMQYLNTFNAFFCYVLYSYGTKDNTIELEHIFSYGIPLNQSLQLKPQLELIVNYMDSKYNFIIARSRLGLKFSKYCCGIGADILDVPNQTDTSYGVFCQIEF